MTFDLIEFRYNPEKKMFVKYQTHLTNVSKSLAYGIKKTLDFAVAKNKHTRYRVVENGTLMYSNKFK